ncbi:MAG: hypothetical protein H7Y38_07885 [Armatimonadetes bacterium]|nr:hypothetical protein [Armatimonadota bacterium]
MRTDLPQTDRPAPLRRQIRRNRADYTASPLSEEPLPGGAAFLYVRALIEP